MTLAESFILENEKKNKQNNRKKYLNEISKSINV